MNVLRTMAMIVEKFTAMEQALDSFNQSCSNFLVNLQRKL